MIVVSMVLKICLCLGLWTSVGQVLVLEDPRGQFWSPWSWPWHWGFCPWLHHCYGQSCQTTIWYSLSKL